MLYGFGYHFLLTFFAKTNCDLIIEPTRFKYSHLFGMSLLTISMFLPIGFSIERFVALGMAEKYENIRTLLGPVLVISLICIDLLMINTVYKNEKFSDIYISFILTPTSSTPQINIYFFSLLAVKIFNLISNCILIKIHNRIKKRYLRRNNSLSVRYEMEEIIQSSKFTLTISFSHLLFFGWYIVNTLFIRILGESFFQNSLNYLVARGVYCAVPTYNFVIVFIGIISLRRLNLQRHNKVQSTVQIKSTGREGARNYENAISNYWDSISHEMNRMNT
ncbi:unnamed protein product [Caenorhabditis brenneri]